jgi:hypothetical protein
VEARTRGRFKDFETADQGARVTGLTRRNIQNQPIGLSVGVLVSDDVDIDGGGVAQKTVNGR